MHRAPVRAVGLELGAIQFREQRMDFRQLEHSPDSNRAVTRELLEPILERGLAAAAKAAFVSPMLSIMSVSSFAPPSGPNTAGAPLSSSVVGPNGSTSKPIARSSLNAP